MRFRKSDEILILCIEYNEGRRPRISKVKLFMVMYIFKFSLRLALKLLYKSDTVLRVLYRAGIKTTLQILLIVQQKKCIFKSLEAFLDLSTLTRIIRIPKITPSQVVCKQYAPSTVGILTCILSCHPNWTRCGNRLD